MHPFHLLFFYLFLSTTVLTTDGELWRRGVESGRNIEESKFYCLGHSPSLGEWNFKKNEVQWWAGSHCTRSWRASSCPIFAMSPLSVKCLKLFYTPCSAGHGADDPKKSLCSIGLVTIHFFFLLIKWNHTDLVHLWDTRPWNVTKQLYCNSVDFIYFKNPSHLPTPN